MVGSVRYGVQNGDVHARDEADVAIQVSVTDVRCAATSVACPGGALSDYEGAAASTVSTRITDRSNVPPARTACRDRDTQFPMPLDCTATASTSIGSSAASPRRPTR